MSVRLPAIAASLAVLLLAGCGPGVVTSNVLRFHSLPASAEGRTFAIVPQESQTGSLEFKTYANLVSKRMASLGFREGSPQSSDLLVRIDYSVDDGRTEIWSTPIYSYNDYWRRYYGAQATWPYPYSDLTGASTNSTTVYTHRLEVQMADAKASRSGTKSNVFEGRAVAERQTRELVTTLPYLVDALFDHFPGISGEPVTVRIPQQAGR